MPQTYSCNAHISASAATFSRFISSVKSRFDYGAVIFILTFTLVSVSGYRVNEISELAFQRLLTIFIGTSFCILISIFFYPTWAGAELHRLIYQNLEKLADSLDGNTMPNNFFCFTLQFWKKRYILINELDGISLTLQIIQDMSSGTSMTMEMWLKTPTTIKQSKGTSMCLIQRQQKTIW